MKIMEEDNLLNEDFFVNTALIDENVIKYISSINNKIKIKELIAEGVLDKEISKFQIFNLINDLPRNTLFRSSEKSNDILTNFWIGKVFTKAFNVLCDNPDIVFFREKITKSFLKEIAKLSNKEFSIKFVQDSLLDFGIVLIIEKYIKSSKVDGTIFKLDNGIPVIGMSLRFSRLDYFWFTLLHELSHLKLHYDLLNDPIVDNMDDLENTEVEIQANILAKYSIVDKSKWRTCEVLQNKNIKSLFSFAEEQEVHPSLIAGLIRNELNDYTIFSELVNSFNVRK
jgi:HTH-type transcriptional regulator/antitoxin HigA